MTEIKIFITDDHSLFRRGVIESLIGKPGINFIGEADHGRELLDKLEYLKPDLVIMGIMMPVLDGVQTMPILRKNYPDLKVIILSMHNDPAVICKMLELGANAYLTKEKSSEEIYLAIIGLQHNWLYINDTVQKAIAARQVNNEGYNTKELEIVKLLKENLTIKEISEKVNQSSRYLEAVISNLKTKLNVTTVEELINKLKV